MSVLKIISYGLFVIYIEKKVFDFEREYFWKRILKFSYKFNVMK
jgi:hypothetical protein